MMRFPRLKTFLAVFPLGDAAWGLRGGGDEQWRIRLHDERAIRAFGALLPYLDGRTAVEDILRSLDSSGIHRGAAVGVLRQLEASAFLEDADTAGLSEADLRDYADQIRFLSRFTQDGGAKLQAILRKSRVGLLGDGRLAESVYGRLACAGFGEVVVLSRQPSQANAWIARAAAPGPAASAVELDPEEIWPADQDLPRLLLVCQDAHDPLLLEAVDALSKRRRLPWLLVRNLEVQEGWVGPLFVPGETASYLSLEARLQAGMARSQPEYQTYDAHVRATAPPPALGGLHAAFDVLAGIAVVEAIKFVTEITVPELLGRFLTINLWTWETEVHDVLRVPALDRRAAAGPAVFPWKALSHDDRVTPSAGA